jgi:hypothetical protein
MLIILVSCQEDEEKRSGIQLSFEIKGSVRLVDSEASSIKVTILNTKGTVVFDQKVPLVKTGDTYVSQIVPLRKGDYLITEFNVLNAEGVVIYSAPVEGSERADLVIDPLNVETSVPAGKVTNLTIEVLATKYNKALSFDGIDDYVDLGNIYDDIRLPISVSAWIWVDPDKTSQIPIFVSQDNPQISEYKGFYLIINPTHLFTGYGDGLGTNNSAYRSDISGPQSGQFGKWIYVAGVIRGAEDMDVYLDGVSLEKIYTGSSLYPMASNFPTATAKIGTWTTNGNTFKFKGLIDELKVWNIALTAEEINYEKTNRPTGNEVGLIGYWNFDEATGEQLLDRSGENYNGIAEGPVRVAAPITGF